MGGLAARDYLQNSDKWQSDGRHHVAKLITVGTPHGGSDLTGPNLLSLAFSGNDEFSEATRDLRISYYTGNQGAYLYSGYEDKNRIRGLLLNFYNVDVNCNGRTGDYVDGLNRKSTIPGDLAYAGVIGLGINTTPYFIDGDGVVEGKRADLKNYYQVDQDNFYAYKLTNDISGGIHRDLPEKYNYQNLQALDEPGTSYLAYEIKPGNSYYGFFSPQANPSSRDVDRYKVYANDKGYFRVETSNLPAYPVTGQLIDDNGTVYGSGSSSNGSAISFSATVPRSGYYYLSLEANSFDNTVQSYGYRTDFQAVLDKPLLSVVGPQTLCEGQSVTLQGPLGYSLYNWFKDGTPVYLSNRSDYLVTSSGNYALVVSRNGADSPKSDLASLIFKPTTPVPTVPSTTTTYCIGDVAQPLSATGIQLQWYTQATGGTAATAAPTLSTASARTLTYYVTQTNPNSCESSRQPITVTVTAPPVAPGIAANQFVCQYGKPVPLTAQGQNLLWRVTSLTATSETAPIPATDKVDTLRYTVTQRVGSCISPAASVTVTVRKAPDLPKVVTPVNFCINTKADALTATGNAIRWYAQADRSGQSSTVFAPPTDKAGPFTYYATQTDANGCESLTNPITVTIRPKPTATLPNDLTVYRYDSVAVDINLTGYAPWRVVLWNGRELTAAQSPLKVYIKPTATASYTLQSVSNECGSGDVGRTLRVTVAEPLAVLPPQRDDLWLSAYPIPTEGSLKVDWAAPTGEAATLQLISLNGQIIWQRPVRGTGVLQTESLQLQNQPGGRYMLRLATPTGVLIRQIMKQ